ncbi:hypothetical protein BGX38DRAFT_1140869 [Terfezia claveryi]|nr:hypothetical protein BGX38DRAFT_1140869 [Terfezia claveryi]
MQFRNIIAVLCFLIANIGFASAIDDVTFVTMTTEIEVTSTVYVGTVTMTGQPTTTQESSYIPLTTIYSNNTVVEPTATGTGSQNSTAPTPSTSTKNSSSSATNFSGSIRLAAAAGAIAAVLGML